MAGLYETNPHCALSRIFIHISNDVMRLQLAPN